MKENLTKEELIERCDNAMYYLKKGEEELCERELEGVFDDNYYGEGHLQFGRRKIEIESVWTYIRAFGKNEVCIHFCTRFCEGDIQFGSLSDRNKKRIIDMIREHIV